MIVEQGAEARDAAESRLCVIPREEKRNFCKRGEDRKEDRDRGRGGQDGWTMDPEGELQHAASGSRGRSSVVMPHTMSPEAYTSDMRDEPPVGFSTLGLPRRFP